MQNSQVTCCSSSLHEQISSAGTNTAFTAQKEVSQNWHDVSMTREQNEKLEDVPSMVGPERSAKSKS